MLKIPISSLICEPMKNLFPIASSVFPSLRLGFHSSEKRNVIKHVLSGRGNEDIKGWAESEEE